MRKFPFHRRREHQTLLTTRTLVNNQHRGDSNDYMAVRTLDAHAPSSLIDNQMIPACLTLENNVWHIVASNLRRAWNQSLPPNPPRVLSFAGLGFVDLQCPTIQFLCHGNPPSLWWPLPPMEQESMRHVIDAQWGVYPMAVPTIGLTMQRGVGGNVQVARIDRCHSETRLSFSLSPPASRRQFLCPNCPPILLFTSKSKHFRLDYAAEKRYG
jgi:hypothetical protein